jgi:hypothetical protein
VRAGQREHDRPGIVLVLVLKARNHIEAQHDVEADYYINADYYVERANGLEHPRGHQVVLRPVRQRHRGPVYVCPLFSQ